MGEQLQGLVSREAHPRRARHLPSTQRHLRRLPLGRGQASLQDGGDEAGRGAPPTGSAQRQGAARGALAAEPGALLGAGGDAAGGAGGAGRLGGALGADARELPLPPAGPHPAPAGQEAHAGGDDRRLRTADLPASAEGAFPEDDLRIAGAAGADLRLGLAPGLHQRQPLAATGGERAAALDQARAAGARACGDHGAARLLLTALPALPRLLALHGAAIVGGVGADLGGSRLRGGADPAALAALAGEAGEARSQGAAEDTGGDQGHPRASAAGAAAEAAQAGLPLLRFLRLRLCLLLGHAPRVQERGAAGTAAGQRGWRRRNYRRCGCTTCATPSPAI